jgi:hypothetical protein
MPAKKKTAYLLYFIKKEKSGKTWKKVNRKEFSRQMRKRDMCG